MQQERQRSSQGRPILMAALQREREREREPGRRPRAFGSCPRRGKEAKKKTTVPGGMAGLRRALESRRLGQNGYGGYGLSSSFLPSFPPFFLPSVLSSVRPYRAVSGAVSGRPSLSGGLGTLGGGSVPGGGPGAVPRAGYTPGAVPWGRNTAGSVPWGWNTAGSVPGGWNGPPGGASCTLIRADAKDGATHHTSGSSS